jgi:formylglycine-generating enzyme required for sulfatase activity
MEFTNLKEDVIDLGDGIKLEMVLIPSGRFIMGSPESEFGRRGDETQHEVIISKDFYLGKYEVTQEQWERVMGNNPSSEKGKDLPVTDISWDECVEFTKKLNDSIKQGFRLPTEAEWEYACRAGTQTAYAFGNNITKEQANFDGMGITPVGKYKSNDFGIYDMHGNLWEWCSDWASQYEGNSVTDPKGPDSGTSCVLRGGTFFNSSSFVRSANRVNFTPNNRSDIVGFRLARTNL